MAEITTRKVSPRTVELLKELQEHLKRRGIEKTQQELLDFLVLFSTGQEEQLYQLIKSEQEDPIKTFLRSSSKGPRTNCVKEIDEVL